MLWFEDECLNQNDEDNDMITPTFEHDRCLPSLNREIVNLDYQNFPIGKTAQEKFGTDIVASYALDTVSVLLFLLLLLLIYYCY